MSQEFDYKIALYDEKDKQNLVSLFQVSTHNDQPRGEIQHGLELVKNKKQAVNLIEFIGKYDFAQPILSHNDEIIESLDSLEAYDINPQNALEQFKYGFDIALLYSYKIDGNSQIDKMISQLDLLIDELLIIWQDFDETNQKRLLGFYYDNYQMKDINLGYEEAETVLFDILGFLKYALDYLSKHPTAEIYYERYDKEWFDEKGQVYDFVKSHFK